MSQKQNAKCKFLKRSEVSCTNKSSRFVCATRKESVETVIFRSYASARGGVKIWEAACATLATSSIFDPSTSSEFEEQFFSERRIANNPTQEVWNEAQIFVSPKALIENVNCLVSIGTGIPSLQPFGDDCVDIATTLKEIATENEKRAKTFHNEHWDLDVRNLYFRFNVLNGLEDIGLEVASQRDAVISATNRYLDSRTVTNQMKLCGKPQGRSKVVSSSKLAATKVTADGVSSVIKVRLHISES
jgi:hypothetical protein